MHKKPLLPLVLAAMCVLAAYAFAAEPVHHEAPAACPASVEG